MVEAEPPEVDLAAIREAASAIEKAAYRTPTVPASRDEEGIYLKLENLQRTGSFKVRGAYNAARQVPEAQRKRGFVTVSAGNHGQALAWAARRLDAPCTVWVPEDAVEAKVAKMQASGASIERMPHEEIMESMTTRSFPHAGEQTYVHPFADPGVLAGQGTVGLEILEDLDDVGTVLVPVGGGGLSSGIGTALKALRPEVEVYGVQSETSPALVESFEHGEARITGPPDTFADGIATDRVFSYMWPLLEEVLDGAFAVADGPIEDAMRHLARESNVVVEGAGAAALAVARERRDELAEPIVAVVSGGNVAADRLRTVLED